ncbi:hypothetical protein OAA78_02270 [Flavobacteriaceae bacterium]|nr:hypothetical protein [Flavobacteriaceae bacterium]MDC1492255.1 hypothetical protein [Flavobacteriaceae bacterium]
MNNKKEVFKGFFYGVISSLLGLILAVLILSENNSIIESLKNSYYENFLGKLISLGAILNVIVFFFFIKKKQDERAKGILLLTILLALFTLILNYL